MRPCFLNLNSFLVFLLLKNFKTFVFISFIAFLSTFQRSLFLEILLKYFKTKHDECVFQLVFILLRKEVIHPHVLVGIPCYDLTPIICPTLDGFSYTSIVRPPASGITNSHGLTGGVYKT